MVRTPGLFAAKPETDLLRTVMQIVEQLQPAFIYICDVGFRIPSCGTKKMRLAAGP